MIPFTQFKRPNGRRVLVEIERPPEIEKVANELIKLGCRFEVEVLMTGEVSFTVEKGENTIAVEICENGPQVLDAVDALVKRTRAAMEEKP